MEVQPIVANPDVLKLYHKQKSELHFQQKSDNEFLIFLLDVAVKVIRFVDTIKPGVASPGSDDEEPPKKSNDKTSRTEAEDAAERPSKVAKYSSGSFMGYPEKQPNQRSSSDILQRQQELSRQVDNFPFPTLSDNVIKPTFVKDGLGAGVRKLRTSLQGSPNTSEREEEEEEKGGQGGDESLEGSTPSTPLTGSTPLTFRARSDSSNLNTAGTRLLQMSERAIDFHNLSPSKVQDLSLLEQKTRVLDKIGTTAVPSMAYMFSDKLATSAETTSDPQRGRHLGTMQWASEYKFDGSALHIMNGRNSRKPRTVFTWEQLKQMEETFKQKKYLCTEDRMILAQKLDLTDEQIKVWFQNRRQKWKKGGSKEEETVEYSQYYDLFSRDGRGDSRDENCSEINIPEHLRGSVGAGGAGAVVKAEPITMATADQTTRAILEHSQLKEELQKSLLDIQQQQAASEKERSLIRKQQMRAVESQHSKIEPQTTATD